MFLLPFFTYQLFYLLAFLAVIIVVLVEGRNRNIPAIPWLMVICTSFTFFLVGSKVVTLTPHEWRTISQFKPLNYSPGATVIGGLVFSFFGLLLARYFLKLPWSILDAFAYTIPIGMCVQRFGCLQAGCCYGKATEVPWAIAHKINGHEIIPSAIHPVQVYESIGCVLIVIILLVIRHSLKSPVNFLFFSALCYYVLRFILEFFRDVRAYAFDVTNFGGLTTMQWMLLLLVISSSFVITIRERFYQQKKENPLPDFHLRHIIYLFILCLIVQVSFLWMSITDRVIITLTLVSIFILLSIKVYSSMMIPFFRLKGLGLIGCAVMLMSQTAIDQKNTTKEGKETYNTISGSIMSGKIDFEKEIITGGGTSCDGTTSSPITTTDLKYNEKYSSISGGYSRTWVSDEHHKISAGLNLLSSSFTETIEINSNKESRKSNTYFTANPYFTSDFKYFGFSVGMHIGNSSTILYDSDDYAETMLSNSSFKPQVGLRAGRSDGVFFAGHLYDNSVPMGLIPWQLGIGFGSKKIRGNTVELGASAYSTVYVAPTFVIKQNILFKPYVGIGPGIINGSLNGMQSSSGVVGAFSVSTIFGRKKR